MSSALQNPLEEIVLALTQQIADVAANGESAISRLQAVQKRLEGAASISDLREIKAHFAQHLDWTRDETLRQQTALSDLISRVIGEFKRIPAPAVHLRDELTGLSGRAHAEADLAEALKGPTPSYLTLFVVEHLEPVAARFGFAIAEELLLYFSQHLTKSLRNIHTLFRWDSSSFLTLTVSPAKQDIIRDELHKLASARLEKSIKLGSRTALLPISCRYLFVPASKSIEPNALIRELDGFVAAAKR